MTSKLVDKPVFQTIVKMAIPMLAGTFAINMYQITNAWFVSRLGTDSLAAISFTFPVIMFFTFLLRGLGMGSMTMVAHALGGQDVRKAAKLASSALILAFVSAAVLTTAGILTINPLFTLLGATGNVLRLTKIYMVIWYLGSAIMIVQMLVTDIISASGNTKVISALMVTGSLINAFLDFALIFGKFGMPKMGIGGAAIATLLSQAITMAGGFYILRHKMGLLHFSGVFNPEIFKLWFQIIKFGIPSALGLVLLPLASAVITKFVADYGTAAVAASGVAGRIEMFAFMIPMSVGISLMPFIAQNYGARNFERILRARKGTMIFALTYGLFIGIVFLCLAEPMAFIFSKEKAVVDVLKAYICITCAGYGMMEIHRYAGFCMTGTNEPVKASILNITRAILFLIPLSMLGNWLFQLNGIFFGRLLSDLLSGSLGIWWSGKVLKKQYKTYSIKPAAQVQTKNTRIFVDGSHQE